MKTRPRFKKIEKKELKRKFNFSIGDKKYYAYNKVDYFARDYQLKNLVNKNKILTNII